jgi:hypothetical protein
MRKKRCPSDMSRDGSNRFGPFWNRRASAQAAQCRPVRGLVRSAVPVAYRLSVARIAQRLSEVANGALVLCQVERS